MMGANVVLAFGIVLAAFTTLALVASRFRPKFLRHARLLSVVTAELYALVLLYLAVQFLTTDYSNGYVWNHTADYLHPVYKLSGVFAGIEGSLLLWTTFVAIAVAYLLNRRIDRPGGRLVGAIATLVLVYLGVVLLLRTPFQSLMLSGGEYVYGPRGLNPLLIDPFMVIHPPVTFLGYALTTVPFAVGIAHFVRRIRGRSGLFRTWLPTTIQWLRAAWVFLTAAVALGALWSYTTLGWGGLWAWDPVETGILVSWLVVTAALHAVANTRSRGSNPILAGTLTALSLPAVVFARYVTIGGFSDLHSFGLGSPTPTLFLLSVTTALAVGLPLAIWLRQAEPGEDSGPDLLSLEMGVYLSVLVLLAVTFVYGWGIVFPRVFGLFSLSTVSVTADFFNTWTYPFAVLGLLMIGALNDFRLRGKQFWVPLAVTVVVTGIVAVIPMGWQFGVTEASGYYSILSSINSLSLVPPALYAIGPSLVRLQREIGKSGGGRRFDSLGYTIIHVGIALLIISAPLTYLGATSGDYIVPADPDSELSIESGDLSIDVQNVDTVYQGGYVSISESEREQLVAGIREKGYPPSQVPASTDRNVIVWGSVTDTESTDSLVRYQLNDSDVWVETFSDRAPIDNETEESTLYVQGSVNTSGQEQTVVRSDGQFIGTDPMDAIVPAQRVTSSHIDLTVSDDDRLLVTGRASVHNHFQYGVVTDVLLDRGLVTDTYVIPNQVTTFEGDEVAVVSVKRIPMMSLVRLSILLLVLGGAIQFRYGPTSGRSKNREKGKPNQ